MGASAPQLVESGPSSQFWLALETGPAVACGYALRSSTQAVQLAMRGRSATPQRVGQRLRSRTLLTPETEATQASPRTPRPPPAPAPYTASRWTRHSVACMIPLSCTTHPLTSAASSLRPASLCPARWSAPLSTAGVIYHPLPSQAVEKTLTTPAKVRPQVLKYTCMPLAVGPALSSIYPPPPLPHRRT